LLKLIAEAEAAAKSRHASLLVRQLAASELPRTLGYWFAEFEACRRLASLGGATALAVLEDGVDAEGVIHSKNLPWLRPLLASWTRMAAMEELSPKSERVVSAQPRFERLVGQVLRLTRDDASQALSPLGAGADSKESTAELFRAALRIAGEQQRRLAALALPAAIAVKGKKPASSKKGKTAAKLPPAAFNSELSQLAVLRTGWASWEERLTVAYHEQQLAAELICGREVVGSGTWSPESRSTAYGSNPNRNGKRCAGFPTTTSTIWSWKSSSQPACECSGTCSWPGKIIFCSSPTPCSARSRERSPIAPHCLWRRACSSRRRRKRTKAV
jgi:hypothetical protein